MTRQDLTEEDAELLEELEGEFGRAGGFRRLFPVVSVSGCVCVCVYGVGAGAGAVCESVLFWARAGSFAAPWCERMRECV